MKLPRCCLCLSLAMFSIAGCSTSNLIVKTDEQLFKQSLNPTPPSVSDFANNNAVLDENLLLFAQSQEEMPLTRSLRVTRSQPQAQSHSPASNYMSLMGQNGTVLTVWALARRNWLWAYAPIDSHSFGNIRNWRLVRGFGQEHFRFINQQLRTCIQAYGNGLIHDTCNKNNLDQEFELLPRSNGSVSVKSVSQGRCVTYDPVSTKIYSTITLQPCTDEITPLKDQSWYLSPPILSANSQI
ncbi:MAG: cytolethal distending toxin subunit A/C [Pasteurellaceae bacterium]|nr:cytolethal distending toxin subunit A/C [Pasteurellaceae bacterium]